MTNESLRMIDLVGSKILEGIAELSSEPEKPNVKFGIKAMIGQGNSPEEFKITIERGGIT